MKAPSASHRVPVRQIPCSESALTHEATARGFYSQGSRGCTDSQSYHRHEHLSLKGDKYACTDSPPAPIMLQELLSKLFWALMVLDAAEVHGGDESGVAFSDMMQNFKSCHRNAWASRFLSLQLHTLSPSAPSGFNKTFFRVSLWYHLTFHCIFNTFFVTPLLKRYPCKTRNYSFMLWSSSRAIKTWGIFIAPKK